MIRRILCWLGLAAPPVPARAPMTWDCTARSWGRSTDVVEVLDGGRIRFAGWHPHAHRFRVGDDLLVTLLFRPVRYRIETLWLPGDPPDQWFATAAEVRDDSDQRNAALRGGR